MTVQGLANWLRDQPAWMDHSGEEMAERLASPEGLDVLRRELGVELPEETLRRYADEIEGWYPPDVFTPPTSDKLHQARKALALAERAASLDAIAAHMARHYCGVLRRRAAEVAAERAGGDT